MQPYIDHNLLKNKMFLPKKWASQVSQYPAADYFKRISRPGIIGLTAMARRTQVASAQPLTMVELAIAP
jgi:hypothetical protein